MKFLFVCDVHESAEALEWLLGTSGAYDAVVVGGDVTSWGRRTFLDEFLEALSSRGSVLFVPGNGDPREVVSRRGITMLHGSSTKLGGYTVGGLGGSNTTPFGTPFELADDEARKILASLGPVDVLVSHSPPFGTVCDRTVSGEHAGSVPVREYVERRRPRLVLSGHIHESRGVGSIGPSKVVNPGPLMQGNYAEVDGALRVELKNAAFRVPDDRERREQR